MMGKRQIFSLFVIAKQEKDECPTREGKKKEKKKKKKKRGGVGQT
jgi:hypothetical protein